MVRELKELSDVLIIGASAVTSTVSAVAPTLRTPLNIEGWLESYLTLLTLVGGLVQGKSQDDPTLPFIESIQSVLPYLRGLSLAVLLLTEELEHSCRGQPVGQRGGLLFRASLP